MFRNKFVSWCIPFVALSTLHANDPLFNNAFGDDSFKKMIQMQKQMDSMFAHIHQRLQTQKSMLALQQPHNTYNMAVQNQFVDKGDHYELVTSIPQSKDNRIDIQVSHGLMSIQAQIVQNKTDKHTKTHAVHIYQQSMSTPQDINANSVKTDYQNNVLVVSIAKIKQEKVPFEPSKIRPHLLKK